MSSCVENSAVYPDLWIELARNVIKVLSEENDIPFTGLFPRNSCEVTSYVFAKIVKDYYPENKVEIVKANILEEVNRGFHFWVEINDFVFDLTAHQFVGFSSSPILGSTENRLPDHKIESKDNIGIKFENWDLKNKDGIIEHVKYRILSLEMA